MITLYNNSKTTIGLANKDIQPNGREDFEDSVLDYPIVKAWIKAKVLIIKEVLEEISEIKSKEESENEKKDRLIAELAHFEIKADRRNAVGTLESMLENAQYGK